MENQQLPEIPMTFPDRAARQQAKKAVAAALKTTVRKVNRLKICDKPLESVQKREKKARKAQEHREKCAEFAKKVVNREISAKRAAIACDISERQMKRYVAQIQKEQHDVQ
jgi:hypothetical protein